jgi:hypothetical protein
MTPFSFQPGPDGTDSRGPGLGKMAETTQKDSDLSKAQSQKPKDLPPWLGSTGTRDEVYIDLP